MDYDMNLNIMHDMSRRMSTDDNYIKLFNGESLYVCVKSAIPIPSCDICLLAKSVIQIKLLKYNTYEKPMQRQSCNIKQLFTQNVYYVYLANMI